MAKTLVDTLTLIGGGSLNIRAGEELAELVKAVDETGKQGTLTLTINIKKATKSGAMHVTGDTKLKTPADSKIESMLFGTPEGNLLADNPAQGKLPLQIIPDNKPTLMQMGEK